MTYNYWKKYFENNRFHFKNIDWQGDDNLTVEEIRLISSSLQQFQRGENSEGKHLMAYAKSAADPVYPQCIRLFIQEEQMHAAVLARFMHRYAIPCIQGHWVDGVFRWLRKLAGIQNSIMILLLAEIISKVYYAALQKCTGSGLLQKICAQVLQDEEQHIAFQCFTLQILFQRKPFFSGLLIRSLYSILLHGTIAVVWLYHSPVLKTGGFSLRGFRQAVMQVYTVSAKIILNKKPIATGNLISLVN